MLRTSVANRLVASAALCAAAALVAAGPVRAQEDHDHAAMMERMRPDEDAIRAVVEGFADALAAGDADAAVAFLHPDLVVYESGHAETLEEYRAGHLAADMEFAGSVDFDTTDEAFLLLPHVALYTSQYTVKGTFRDREIDSHGVETMVLVPTADGWKIRHIHWSSR